jgi:hypothetical protein
MSEPQIISPGAIAFDGDGRMFVAELRSYMLDADATAEKEPTSPHQHAREHEGRRRLRPPHRVRRQAVDAALHHAAPTATPS